MQTELRTAPTHAEIQILSQATEGEKGVDAPAHYIKIAVSLDLASRVPLISSQWLLWAVLATLGDLVADARLHVRQSMMYRKPKKDFNRAAATSSTAHRA